VKIILSGFCTNSISISGLNYSQNSSEEAAVCFEKQNSTLATVAAENLSGVIKSLTSLYTEAVRLMVNWG
jgi:hypothetical protein